jgi:hypothetical protein
MKKYLPILIMAASGALWAQSEEVWLSGGATIIGNGDIGSPIPGGPASDVQLGSGFRVGVRLDYNTAGHVGHEFQYGYNRTNFTDNTGTILPAAGSAGMANHQFGYNVLYYTRATREEAKVRGFFTVGFHISDYVLPQSAGIPGSSVKPGGNVGAGLKIRLSPLFGFRFDVREYVNGKPNWSGLQLFNQKLPLSQTEISAGLGVYF